MKRFNSQKGFSVVEVLLVIVIVALIGFVVWRVIDANNESKKLEEGTAQSTVVETVDVPEPQNASDLQDLNTTLDDIDLDTVDSSLDEELVF